MFTVDFIIPTYQWGIFFETHGVSFRPFQWIESCGSLLHWGISPPSSFPYSSVFKAIIHYWFPIWRLESHSQFQHSEPSSIFSLTFRVVFFSFGVQSHHRVFSLTFRVTFLVSAFRAIIGFQFDVQSRIFQFRRSKPPSFFNLAFRATMSSRLRCSRSSFLAGRSQLSVLVWHLEPAFLHGIRRYYLRFDVQSHVFISTFGAVVLVWHSKPWFWVDIQSYYIIHFSVQSHYSSLLQHSEPLLIFVRCSEPCLLHSAFKATSSFGVQSHYIIHFGVQSHYPSLLQHSEPLLIFVRRSKPCLLHSAFRATFSFSVQSHYIIHFDVQSHYSSSLQHLEPLLIFVWRSEPCFASFDIQSHVFIRRSEPLHHPFWRSEPLHHPFWRSELLLILVLVFRAISSFLFGVQNHILSSSLKVLMSIFRFDPSPFSSILAFRAIGHTLSSFFGSFLFLVLAFKAIVLIHLGTLSHHFLSSC